MQAIVLQLQNAVCCSFKLNERVLQFESVSFVCSVDHQTARSFQYSKTTFQTRRAFVFYSN